MNKIYRCPCCHTPMFKCKILDEIYICCSNCDIHIKIFSKKQEQKKIKFNGLGLA